MSEIKQKTVLITGAALGMGRGLAIELARRGAELVLYDIDAEGLERTARQVMDQCGRMPATYLCDLGKRSAIQKTAKAVLAEHGAPDILINNAGVVFPGTFTEMSDRAAQQTLDVNIGGVLWNTKAFLPAMLERQSGHLVQIASAAGIFGNPGMAVYCASKHAVVGLNESLRKELKQLGSSIKTTVVCPAIVDTGMFAGARQPRLLMPHLKEERMVQRIVEAIRGNEAVVAEPRMVRFIHLFRALTTPDLLDRVGATLGLDHVMDGFRGREAR